ncbi:hypothetical protein ONZ45_g12881 [Pleurotus djamor]|nr:hypothetical protein ONZ45_g12881 [Pleurotus djamor]
MDVASLLNDSESPCVVKKVPVSQTSISHQMLGFVGTGTRQAFLPGGHRTGAPGVHVVRGKAKYRLIDEKVRVFVAPPLEKIEASALKPYVSTQVRLTKPETRQVYGKLPPQGLTASHLLKVARGNGSDLKTA